MNHYASGRSAYDEMMLGLHDAGKLSVDYQNSALRTDVAFPPDTSWLCFTDKVLHAALGGQFVLEQTFHLPLEAMADPARSPLRTLERITGRKSYIVSSRNLYSERTSVDF